MLVLFILFAANHMNCFGHPHTPSFQDIDVDRIFGHNLSSIQIQEHQLTDHLWFHWRQQLRDDYVNAEFLYESSEGHHRRLAQEHWETLKRIVDPHKLKEILLKSKDYNTRSPFPHMYSDEVFPESVLQAVLKEIPDNPSSLNGCITDGRNCFNNTGQKFKNTVDSDMNHGPATSALFAFLKSSMFVQFLEKLTGIEDIIPDPHYRGAGIHQTLPGGLLDVHADFNRYHRYDLHRRVNILLYLNPDWDDSWAGHLELWSHDLERCEVKLSPILGRLVVFSSTDFSYHGHQEPLKCPADRSRRSLAMYYYTRSRPENECLNGDCNSVHSTLWQKTACPSCTSNCGDLRRSPEFNRPKKVMRLHDRNS